MFIPSTFKRPVSSWKALNLRKTLLMASSVRLKPLNCSRLPCVYGAHFRRVSLGPELDYRRGLLGQGSFLSITWVQNFRTSPVKRGVWVLENILGTAAPEPPPNVPPLEDSTAGATKVLTLREQMTLHRKNEPCASCHKLMDNIGFPLENFDADATWRTKQGGDGGTPIDP